MDREPTPEDLAQIECDARERAMADNAAPHCEDCVPGRGPGLHWPRDCPHRPNVGAGDFSIGSPVWSGVSKVIEECGELLQVLGKIIAVGGAADRHWDGDLRPRLIEEVGDLQAALNFFVAKNLTREEYHLIIARVADKRARFEEWHRKQTGAVR